MSISHGLVVIALHQIVTMPDEPVEVIIMSEFQRFVNLTFAVGTDMQAAKLDVINNLTQAPPRPSDAIEPQVNAGGGPQMPGAASLLVRVLPDNPNRELANYQKLIKDEVQPRLARIPGVSQVLYAVTARRSLVARS